MNDPPLTPETRVVFFDAVGTLLTPHPPAVDVYLAVGRRHGSLLSRSAIAQRFREAFRVEEEEDAVQGWATSEERERRRWSSIVDAVFRAEMATEDCFRELWDHFAQPTAWRVAAAAGEVVDALVARGLVVGVASNYDRRLHTVLDGLPELTGLRLRIASSEVGWRKPDRRFFDAVVHAARCSPEQIAFVGDGLDTDYKGANAAGLRGVLLDPSSQAQLEIRRIRRLTDLLVLPSQR